MSRDVMYTYQCRRRSSWTRSLNKLWLIPLLAVIVTLTQPGGQHEVVTSCSDSIIDIPSCSPVY